MKVILLGGGCFWGLDALFSDFKGIKTCLPGYSSINNTNSKILLNSEIKNYTEVIKLEYDENLITLKEIILAFFSIHDPTILNNNNNKNNKYKSVIFYDNEIQKNICMEMIDKLNNKKFNNNNIITILKPNKLFFPAKNSHKDFFKKKPNLNYCQNEIKPRLDKFNSLFTDISNLYNN